MALTARLAGPALPNEHCNTSTPLPYLEMQLSDWPEHKSTQSHNGGALQKMLRR